jgi:hypothetical protein
VRIGKMNIDSITAICVVAASAIFVVPLNAQRREASQAFR